MNEDSLLNALAGEAKKQNGASELDRRWESYAAGTLCDAEVAELIASVTEEEAAVLTAAFAPLDENFRQQVTNSLYDELAMTSDTQQNSSQEPVVDDNVVDFVVPKRNIFTPLVFAATLLLAVGAWQFGLENPAQSSLPGYELSLPGGSEFRSEAPNTSIAEFTQGDRLEIRLVPATATQEPLEARMYVKTESEYQLAEQVSIDIAPTGAVRITGRIGTQLQFDAGPAEVFVIVGKSGSLPEVGDVSRDLQGKNDVVGTDWQAWHLQVLIGPPQ